MHKRKCMVVGLVCLIAMITAACSPGSKAPVGSSRTSTAHGSYGQANTTIVRPSTRRAPLIVFDDSGAPDSTDPGNTSELNIWDFSRLYATPLMTYKSCTGSCGLQLAPGLATGPGTVSDGGLVWTYHLKPGMRFSNGQAVTAQDVKYAVERTFARSMLGSGPDVFQQLLAPQTPAYQGPFTSGSAAMGLRAVTTPNPLTVQFRLAHPFADFDYVVAMPQTAPVPPGPDTGAGYQSDPISTGPYMFAGYHAGRQITLIDNQHWTPSEDSQVRQLADKIIVNLNVSQATVASQVVGSATQVDMSGVSLPDPARQMILGDATLRTHADVAPEMQLDFAFINQSSAPLGNLACRRAIEYAVSKSGLQAAYGGAAVGGSIATAAEPQLMAGSSPPDPYQSTAHPGGDVAGARGQLAACGQADGFTTTIGYQPRQPAQAAAAQSLQQALGKVGITARLVPVPSATGTSTVGYVRSHGLGIGFGQWTALSPRPSGWFTPSSLTAVGATAASALLPALQAASSPAESALSGQLEQKLMYAAVLVPEIITSTLLYRSPALANVYVQSFYGQYNYAVLGIDKGSE
jgi:peptide/nickel transport system substrate-binding protein